MKKRFRFQDMAIWQKAMQIAARMDDLALLMEQRKWFRYAEQLRGALLSVPNNIAEGCGSDSEAELSHYLRIAKRSCFELANMLFFFRSRDYISSQEAESLLEELDHECRMIESFRKTLRSIREGANTTPR